nr:aminoglycoside phosphotransferase family protein [Lentzea guizhouensis]
MGSAGWTRSTRSWSRRWWRSSSRGGATFRCGRCRNRGGTTAPSGSATTSRCGCPAHRGTSRRSRRRTGSCRCWPRTCRCPCRSRSRSGGRPGRYPFPWSVRRWLDGTTVESASGLDRERLAADLGRFLVALRAVPADRPAAGRHSYFRGCHPSAYADQVEQALDALAGHVDAAACREVWAEALTSAWPSAPVWFHGDVAVGNLLTAGGALSAVIDFGTCGVGDPACDLVMAWMYFTGAEREVFRAAVGLPDATWRRARGWALWKALVTVAGMSSPDPEGVQTRTLAAVLADPVSA